MLVTLLGQGPQGTMEISNIPIAFCVILGNLIICYIIITVLHVFILLNKIKSNLKSEKGTKTTFSNSKYYWCCIMSKPRLKCFLGSLARLSTLS